MTIALTLHLLGILIWVGGMFFAHMALRPAANALLDPPQRLPLLKQVLDRFFFWVWVAITLILGSGYWIFLRYLQGQAPLYVHIMQGLGLLMTAIFCFIYLVPYRRMGRSLDAGEIALAGNHMAIIRRLIATNLVLGLVTVVLGASKPF